MELERKKALLIRICYYLLFAAAIYIVLRWLWMLLLPFLAGFALAYMLRPATCFICRHSGMPRRSAAIICAVVFYAILIGICWVLCAFFLLKLGQIGKDLPMLYANKIEPVLSLFSDRLFSFVGRILPGLDGGQIYSSMNDALGGMFVSVSTWSLGLVTDFAKSAPMAALTLIFTIMSSVLICADYDGVTNFVMRQIPGRLHSTILDLRDFSVRSILKIVKTYLILMVITFGLLALGLWFLGIEGFAVYAGIIAFLDLLPVIGSGMVLIPWGIVLAVTGKSFTGIGILLLWVFSSFIRELLEPKILGEQIGLHPLATLTAMYFGLRIAGLGGLLLMPLFFLLICHLHDNGVIKLYNEPGGGIDIK